MTEQAWRKSSYSGSQANCVEVTDDAGVILVRDTRNRAGTTLIVAASAWQTFVRRVKGVLAEPEVRGQRG